MIWGHAAVWAALAVWTPFFVFSGLDGGFALTSFLHLPDLLFHEGGHVVFGLLGWDFLKILGGSLMQLLLPAVCALTFFAKEQNPFGAAVCLWWTGQNLVDLAPYVADAGPRTLTLLGGATGASFPELHDWYQLLGATGLLAHHRGIGWGFHVLGSLVMGAGLAWGAKTLWELRREERPDTVWPSRLR